MKKQLIVLLAISLITVFGLAGLASAADMKADTMTLIQKGTDYLIANGPEKAAQAFMTDEFKNGELFLFVYSYDGTMLATGDRPERVGKNFWTLKTPEGNFHIQKLVEIAKSGGAWYEYRWMDTEQKKLREKVSFIAPVKGMDAFIGCGFWKQ